RLSTLHPPPTSTLFPYTTLFRSRVRARPPAPPLLRKEGPGPPLGPAPPSRFLARLHGSRSAAAAPLVPRRNDRPRDAHRFGGLRDRKSTRLNSSHVAISYAVFCL